MLVAEATPATRPTSNGDRMVDTADFLTLLAAWGPSSQPYLLEVLSRS